MGDRIKLIGSLDEAIDNIVRYQAEVKKNATLRKRMMQARVWYGIRSTDGAWLFAPSKFVGYTGNTGETYARRASRGRKDRYDGRETEKHLRREGWFEAVSPDTPLGAEAGDALQRFFEANRHRRPNAKARICLHQNVAGRTCTAEWQDRIQIDAGICGGRPCIRGTRVRVCDILDMLASGMTEQEILSDYPRLSEPDLRAALAWGAAATEHRIVLTG